MNTPAWAVGVFCLSYLAFPWLLERFRGLSGRALLAAMAAAWCASILPGAAYHLAGDVGPGGLQTLYTFPLLRLPEFVFGVLLGRWLLVRGPLSPRQAAWAASLGAAVWLGWISVVSRFPVELFHNGFLAPVQALLIVGLACGGGVPARVLSWRPVQGLGERSLAIYLLHLPMLAWAQSLGVLPRPTVAASAAAFLGYLALVLAAAFRVSDHFVDPVAGWLRRAAASRRPAAVVPAAAG
jgi:peptidoglycan/LPS O-acetylase OafA/YrhL